jgi:hypothetical protein
MDHTFYRHILRGSEFFIEIGQKWINEQKFNISENYHMNESFLCQIGEAIHFKEQDRFEKLRDWIHKEYKEINEKK